MTSTKRISRLLRMSLLATALALVLTSCIGQRQGISWPALSTVTLDGETKIVVAYESRVELLEPATGQIVTLRDEDGDVRVDDDGNPRRWIIEGGDINDGVQFFSDPLITSDDGEETLLFPTYSQTILEFLAENGRLTNPAGIALDGNVLSNITATDDMFYVPYQVEDLAAISRDSYEEQWRVETEEGVWAAPLLNDGVLYVPSLDHILYAVDAETGEELWTVDLEGAITSTPLFYDDALYVGSYAHKLYKISLDGDILAEHEGENWIWSTPVAYENTIYYTDLSGNVYALLPDGLSLQWEAKPAEKGVRAAPLVTDEYVVVSSRDGKLYWLSRENGSEVFEREVEGRPELLSEILLLEGDEEAGVPYDMIVVGSQDTGNFIAAFQLDNSASVWTYGR